MTFVPKGIIPAMVTPLDEQGNLKEKALRDLTNYLIAGGVHGLFAIGSQGEAYGLEVEQKKRAIEIVVEETNGRVPVYAGTGSVTTREAVKLTQIAEKAGAQAVSVVTPFFITPNEEELHEHYRAIANSTKLPVLLYPNPARTGIKMSTDFVLRASAIDNIVGIKDSSGDMTQTAEYIRTARPGFSVLVGRDTLIYSTLAHGGAGSIAATANVAPKLIVEIYDAFMAGDHKRSLAAQYRLAPLRIAFDLGTFPVVIKEALNMMGLDAGYALRPVGPMAESKRESLRKILQEMGLL